MADNLYYDKKGRPFLCFHDLAGVQRKIRLTGLNKRDAQSFASRFKELVSSVKAGVAPSPFILDWVGKLASGFQASFQKYGLISARPVAQLTLNQAREMYLEFKSNRKASTKRNIITASERIFKILGPETLVSSLTKGACEKAVAVLQGKKGAQASVSQTIQKTKSILQHLVDLEIIPKSPMAQIKRGSDAGDPSKYFFVTREMAAQILKACPDVEWRLIIGLARYGGIRVPSELVPMTWADVRFDEHRFYVRSSKTEHHIGKEGRWVPIFPELRPLFLEAYELSKRKDGPVQGRFLDPEDDNPRTQLCRIIRKAGIKPWKKPFNNLRSTRDTELRRAGTPDYKVDAWMGHTLKVAKKHYLQIIEEDYVLAAGALEPSPAPTPTMSETKKPLGPSKSPSKGIVLYDADLRPGALKTSFRWGLAAPKWQACGKDFAESGKKNGNASVCNTLQAVTEGLENKGVVRDSASDCSILQDEKAPRLGLEPRTCELTARRSTN